MSTDILKELARENSDFLRDIQKANHTAGHWARIALALARQLAQQVRTGRTVEDQAQIFIDIAFEQTKEDA